MNVTEAELERLTILQEECAEVIQAVSKIIRFGWNSYHGEITNRAQLTLETGDLVSILNLMFKHDIDANLVADRAELKPKLRNRYIAHKENIVEQ